MDEKTGQVKQRFLQPTEFGIAFIKGCLAIQPELVDPEIRRRLENDLKAIAEGKIDHKEVSAFN